MTHFKTHQLVIASLLCTFAPELRAQTEDGTTPSTTTVIQQPQPTNSNSEWSGPDTSDEFDWIELTSGEWLKGEIKSMQDDELEFDSDNLDLLTLDWEDVRQLLTSRPETVRTEDREEFTGSLRIDEDSVNVTESDGTVRTFDRSQLLGMVQGEARELNYWSFKAGAGVTYQTGNSKQTDVNVNANIQRRTASTRLGLSYLGVYTTTDDVETANNHRASAIFDVFLTRRLFVRPVFAEYFKDRFQNIDHQATIGVAMGYTLIDTSRTDWNVYGGPGYRYTKFVSVPAGESREESTPAFLAGTKWDQEVNDWLDANALYNFGVLNERSGTYTHHAIAGLAVELTGNLDLDLSVVWDRVQTPQQRADGTTPLKDDFRFIVGISVDI